MTPATVLEHPLVSSIRVLLVEDDPVVAEAIDLYLQLLSCQVDRAADAAMAMDRAIHGTYDVIVLDVSLPQMDGVSVCRAVRQRQVMTPILMLTARASEGDKVLGLGAGADDYMTKPFSTLELHARLNALTRRASWSQPAATTRLDYRDLQIDIERRAVMLRGQPVELTAREFDLLAALARHPGRVYSRDQLLDAVWGYSHEGYGHTVNSHVHRLRAKIERDPANPEYVLTVRGVGYKFLER